VKEQRSKVEGYQPSYYIYCTSYLFASEVCPTSEQIERHREREREKREREIEIEIFVSI
jgi:hypothetical protein